MGDADLAQALIASEHVESGWHQFWLIVHVGAVLALLLFHGSSLLAVIRLRQERDRARIRALLDASAATLMPMTIALLGVLVTGIVLGFTEDLWGEGWLWTSIGLLVAVSVVMSVVGTGHYDRIRVAVGADPVHMSKRDRGADRPSEANEAALEALLADDRAWLLSGIGVVGLVAILWLMIVQPF